MCSCLYHVSKVYPLNHTGWSNALPINLLTESSQLSLSVAALVFAHTLCLLSKLQPVVTIGDNENYGANKLALPNTICILWLPNAHRRILVNVRCHDDIVTVQVSSSSVKHNPTTHILLSIKVYHSSVYHSIKHSQVFHKHYRKLHYIYQYFTRFFTFTSLSKWKVSYYLV